VALALIAVSLLMIVAAVPIAFVLISVATLALVFDGGEPLAVVPQQVISGMDSFPMLAVPLFILAGFTMDKGGIARRLVRFARSLVGPLPGGLGQVTVLGTVFFSSVSGSTSADAAAIGGTMIPQLTDSGYTRARATAIVSAACVAAIMIPPNIAFIVYAVVANVSIGQLFLAGVLPGLLGAAVLMGRIAWQARTEKWDRTPWPTLRELGRDAGSALMPLSLIVVVLGGIRYGFYTATEAAAMAFAYALILAAFVYRTLTWRDLRDNLLQTAVLTGSILIIVGAARLLSWVLATQQVPQMIAAGVLGLGGGRTVFLLMTIAVFIPLGTILEGVPAIVMLTPILAPIARQLGIDMVHYGIVIAATQGISVFLPPIGISLLVACSVGRVTPAEVARPLFGYLGLLFIVALVIAFVPELSLFLPRWAGYNR
jgi:tripartite ATP-independent transporter DctM subunit